VPPPPSLTPFEPLLLRLRGALADAGERLVLLAERISSLNRNIFAAAAIVSELTTADKQCLAGSVEIADA